MSSIEYKKEELVSALAGMIGKKIIEIYYTNKHELFQSFIQLAGKVECVLMGGIIIKLNDNSWFHIKDIEYFPDLQLGGLTVEKSPDELPVADRKNHIGSTQWKRYMDNEITAFELHEMTYTSGDSKYVLPLGMSLNFADASVLHIYNAFVEDYDAQSKKYQLSIGESLTFFYDDETLKRYDDLEDGQIVEVDQD